ncbi:MAG: Ig-like domain-containing protein, partial [Vitreoscilla sp.]
MSSSPLNRHPHDAVAGHGAKSGIGALQRAAGPHPGEHHLIERGYVPVRQIVGKVVGIWGDAHIRHLDGSVTPLHVGDVVKKGEVVLTAQDGIVQLEARPTQFAGDDVERTISQVGNGNGDIDVAPAAGPNSGGAGGSLEEGLRVGRDAESVTPAALDFHANAVPAAAGAAQAVTPLATAPVANPDTESTASGTPVRFDPRANDSSSSGLTIVAIAGHAISPSAPVALPQGTVAMNADGTLTFTPNHGFSGSLSFTYTDANANGQTSTATVTVDVAAPVDHQPVAVADTFGGIEGQAVGGTLAGNDTPSADGGNVWTLASGPAHGTVTLNTDGTFNYVPEAHYSGADSFTYTITDVDGSTSIATVNLAVAPLTPVAAPDAIDARENTPVSGTLAANDTPVAGETNTWSVATGPAHGTVVVNADGSYTYTPATGYSGTDAFSYTITDASGQTSTATVTLTVAAAPVSATPDSNTVVENGAVNGSLAGDATQVAGDPDTFSLGATTPAHGTVVVNADGSYTYTPAPGYSGPDSFSYVVTDASGATSTSTVTLSVTPLPITALPDHATVNENGTVSGNLSGNATAIAGDPDTFTLASGPAHGTVAVNADGSYTYTPTVGYNGGDSFTYAVTNHSGQVSSATVTIQVAPIDPAAAADTFAATENATTTTLDLASNDTPVAGENSSWSVASNSTAHGTITPAADFATSGRFTYTPNPGFSGTDTFTYTVTDGSGHASTATVTINVAPIDPTAANDTFSATENATTGTLNLAANDAAVAGETNSWSVASTSTANGTITPAADFASSGKFTYTANPGFSGVDSFTYTVTDGSGHASTATVTINVAPIAPAAANDTFSATENAPSATLNLASNDTPVAGETNIWSVASNNTANGTITPAADFATSGNFIYTPNAGFSGVDTFTYTVTDGSGHSSTATATINVAAIVPTAASDTFSATENATTATLDLASNDTPVGGESNTWSVASNSTANGTITPAADFATSGKFTYTPNPGFSGADTFTYTITDGSGHASTATVTINVAAIAPSAANDAFQASENSTTGTLNLASNDTPVAGETNTWSVASNNTANGTITPAADFAASGKFSYTPNAGFSGVDTFTYTVTDGSGRASTATVAINVAAINPTAADDTFNVVENTATGTLSVASNDSAVGGESNTWSLVSNPTHGSLAPAADFATSGKFIYTPDAGYSGTDSFSYTIIDGSGHASTATVTLNVAAVAPVAAADIFSATENSSTATFSVKTNDTPVAGETNTWSVASNNTAHGTITPAADFATTGNFTYTPNPGFSGTDSFTYKITDTDGQTSTATVTINVAAIDPTAASDTFSATENATTATLNLASNDTPVAGEANTWSVASNSTSHGTITPAADFATSGKFTYTPNPGFSGADTFAYIVTDGSGHSSTATVTINVAAIDPTATADTFPATENSTTATLNLASNDTPVAGEINSWSVASNSTAHGTITPAADFATSGKFTYAPNAGFSGPDTFSYMVTDASGHSSTATVTINVAPIDPAAANDAFSATENATTATLDLASNDTPVAGETNTWSVASNATAHGTITPAADFATSGKFTYTPNAGFSGADTFTYTVTDGSGHASSATVTLTVAPINPTAANDAFQASENATTGTLNLASNDTPVAGETNTWSVASNATAHGTITPAADFATSGKFTYTPNAGFSGADTFTYTVTDGSGHSSIATVTINVAAINPTATNDTFSATENAATGTLNLASNDAPVAGETNTWSVASNHTAHGTITPAADFASSGKFTYTPDAGFSGADTFTYTVTDGSGHTSTATVTINVAPINPAAANDTFSATENAATGTLNLASNDTPVAGETNTWSVASNSTAHGSITPAADFATSGKFTYTPNAGFSGADTFTYTVTDGSGHSSTATVTINVAAINPTATNDTFSATENAATGTLNLASNDTPVAGESNTWSVASNSTAHGTITPAADFATSGKFVYTPNTGFSGVDTFSYTVTDGSGHASTATVTINVAAVAPTATNDTFSATENASTGTLNLASNDTPVAGETNTWSVASN